MYLSTMGLHIVFVHCRYALVDGDALSTEWTKLNDKSHTNPLLCLSMKCHGLRLHARLQCLYTYCFTDMQMNSHDGTETSNSNQPDDTERHHLDVIDNDSEVEDDDAKIGEPRSKKWQYSDPLQVCISTYCNGRRQSSFYQLRVQHVYCQEGSGSGRR